MFALRRETSNRIRRRTRCLGKRGRDILLWTVISLFACQILPTLAMDRWRPDLRDPEYAARLGKLRTRRAENPDQPLVLMLGSSRVMNGFQPRALNELASSAGQPMVSFNFGLLCAGPLREHCCLEHLLADHIRPDLLVIEIMPPLFNEPGKSRFCDENWLYIPPLALTDVVDLWPCFARPHRLYVPWTRSRLEPWNEHRRRAIHQLLAGSWMPPPPSVRLEEEVDAWGWSSPPTATVTPEEQAHHIEAARKQYGAAFQGFRVGEQPFRVVCDLLEQCRRQHIPVLLVRMPESTVFRGWYPPEMEAAVAQLGKSLSDRYGADFIDAQKWVPDAEFWDGHHMLPSGAARFTDRMGREVILPRLAKRPPYASK
jgi:hypothetical protein